MLDLHTLIADEKQIIESSPLSEATKVGQVYCYLSTGPIPMIKIGKGKNGRQRMASWLKEYPPSWRNGHVVFIVDKMNQSKGETNLHKLFAKQRVPFHFMRGALDVPDWQRLPDGASEWFFCDTFVKESFRSVGIDLVALYKSEPDTIINVEPSRSRGFLYKVTRLFRGFLGWATLAATVALAVMTWGSWILFGIILFLGIVAAGAILPED